MGILLKIVIYYLAGSAVAGGVIGAGFATNLSKRISKSQLQAIEKMGTYVALKLDGIDGGLIAAPNGRRPTLVYVHGRSANRTELLPLAKLLFDSGYNAVLWDAKSRQINYGPREIEQIRRIVTFVRNDPHVASDKIYVAGFSLGAAMAIGAAASDEERHIRAVVADSPYADLAAVASHYVRALGVIPSPIAWPARTVTFAAARALHDIDFESRNPADWADRVACPVLLIHGKSDRTVPPHHSQEILERLRTKKELWLVEDAGHTAAFKKNPKEYQSRVVRFLDSVEVRQ